MRSGSLCAVRTRRMNGGLKLVERRLRLVLGVVAPKSPHRPVAYQAPTAIKTMVVKNITQRMVAGTVSQSGIIVASRAIVACLISLRITRQYEPANTQQLSRNFNLGRREPVHSL